MSMQRAIARNIAKNRLIDAGYERPGKRLSITANGRYKRAEENVHRGRKNSRTRRAFFNKIRRLDPPTWRRVFCGDLSKKFSENSKKIWAARGKVTDAKRARKKEARRLLELKRSNRSLKFAGETR